MEPESKKSFTPSEDEADRSRSPDRPSTKRSASERGISWVEAAVIVALAFSLAFLLFRSAGNAEASDSQSRGGQIDRPLFASAAYDE
jgi:hypothetical protein